MFLHEEPFKAIRAVDLVATQFQENYSYLDPGILVKGGTLLLGGLAKIGKSLVMMEIVRSLCTGRPLFDNPQFTVPEKKKVLYIEAENGPRAVKSRILKTFQEEDPFDYENRFWVCSVKNPPQLSKMKPFVDMINEVRPNVIVMDPISFFYPGEENSNPEVNKVFYALNHFKTLHPEDETSIVIAHHFGKPPWNKKQAMYDDLSEYNFRGASKWKDAADTTITMHRFSEIDLDWEAWHLKMRFLCRHGSAPPESFYTANEKDDLRIRFQRIAVKQTRRVAVVKGIGTQPAKPAGVQTSLLDQIKKDEEKKK